MDFADNIAMNVGSATSAAMQALQSVGEAEQVKTKAQVSLLKKSLDSQQDAAAQLLKMLEGKGQQIDIRV